MSPSRLGFVSSARTRSTRLLRKEEKTPVSPASQEGRMPGLTSKILIRQLTDTQNQNLSHFVDFPPIDLNEAMKTLSNMSEEDPKDKAIKSMYAMMISSFGKIQKVNAIEKRTETLESKVESLKAKMGGSDEVAQPLSLVIRNLPPPPPGVSEIGQVRQVMVQIRAQGFDPQRDVIKVVRKGAATATPLAPERHGSIMVELINDEARAKIVKKKKCLEMHSHPLLRNLIITNMKTLLEMRTQHTLNEILKLAPGGSELYIAGNGTLRPKDQSRQQQQQAQPHLLPRPRPQQIRPQDRLRPQNQPFITDVQPPLVFPTPPPAFPQSNQGRSHLPLSNPSLLPPVTSTLQSDNQFLSQPQMFGQTDARDPAGLGAPSLITTVSGADSNEVMSQ